MTYDYVNRLVYMTLKQYNSNDNIKFKTDNMDNDVITYFMDVMLPNASLEMLVLFCPFHVSSFTRFFYGHTNPLIINH
jgi:hypothetical protein